MMKLFTLVMLPASLTAIFAIKYFEILVSLPSARGQTGSLPRQRNPGASGFSQIAQVKQTSMIKRSAASRSTFTRSPLLARFRAADGSHIGYLFAGFSSLMICAFIDNARGPILPVLLTTLQIPYETAGLFLTMGSLTAVVATFLLGRALQHWDERRVAIAACLLAMTPGFIAPFVNGKLSLLLLGILLGAVIGGVGSICSILTIKGSAPSHRGRYLSLQNAMYGLGSMTAPWAFRSLVSAQLPWWWLLAGSSLVLLALGVVFARILPEEPRVAAEDSRTSLPKAGFWGGFIVVLFALYVPGEVLASMWMSSLMVDHQGKSPSEAASYLMGFFVVLGLTRLLCFLFARQRHEPYILVSCIVLAIIFALLGQQGHSWALPAIGILGPFFPLSMARLSIQFPKSWKSMTIYVYGSVQMTLAIMHLSVGKVADQLGIAQAFLLAPAFLCVTLVLLIVALRASVAEAAV
jgi:MFS family permease